MVGSLKEEGCHLGSRVGSGDGKKEEKKGQVLVWGTVQGLERFGLSKLIVLRLRKVMALVVHPDKTCGVPGDMCGMNLALIRDALA